MKKKVLWFSNCPFGEIPINTSGTWLNALGQALTESESVQLANISQDKVKEPMRKDSGTISQWLVPFEKLRKNGLPSDATLQYIKGVVNEFQPDLIQVWGTENYWGLLTARRFLIGPVILEMQGIKYACAKVYHAGLTIKERLRCVGPYEILRPRRSLFMSKIQFEKWGLFEKEMILNHDFISTQSNWVRAHVYSINPLATPFETGILLRKEFYDAKPYMPELNKKKISETIFTISSGATAYKGLHVLLRAVAILKKEFSNIRLEIAGNLFEPGIRKSGYARWLVKEIERLSIKDHISFLGSLNTEGIIEHVNLASVVVIPSFVESYCLSLAESMLLGAPLVVSFAGAMPELASDEKSALFFPVGDETVCALKIKRLLRDRKLAGILGKNARNSALEKNDPNSVLMQQLQIYDKVLSLYMKSIVSG